MNRRTFLRGVRRYWRGCARDRRPRLNVFNWSSYIDPETVPEFRTRVRRAASATAIYESNEEMLARVMSGNSGWDIVFPDRLPGQADARERTAGGDSARPAAEPEISRCGFPAVRSGIRNLQWSVPYMVTAAGIAYNRKLSPPPTAWADLWRTRLRGKITMLDDPFDVMGACLKKLGDSVNASDPAQLQRGTAPGAWRRSRWCARISTPRCAINW